MCSTVISLSTYCICFVFMICLSWPSLHSFWWPDLVLKNVWLIWMCLFVLQAAFFKHKHQTVSKSIWKLLVSLSITIRGSLQASMAWSEQRNLISSDHYFLLLLWPIFIPLPFYTEDKTCNIHPNGFSYQSNHVITSVPTWDIQWVCS